MTTVTQVKLTCDVCGGTNEVKTRTFGLDGKAYEIDLCRKDGNALGRVAARYKAKARKATPRGVVGSTVAGRGRKRKPAVRGSAATAGGAAAEAAATDEH